MKVTKQTEVRQGTDSHWSFQVLFELESSTALTCCSIPMMTKESIIGGLVAKWARARWPLWSNELVSQLKSLVWLRSGLDISLKNSYTVIWCIICLSAWSRLRLLLWPKNTCVGSQLIWMNKWMSKWERFMWCFIKPSFYSSNSLKNPGKKKFNMQYVSSCNQKFSDLL